MEFVAICFLARRDNKIMARIGDLSFKILQTADETILDYKIWNEQGRYIFSNFFEVQFCYVLEVSLLIFIKLVNVNGRSNYDKVRINVA